MSQEVDYTVNLVTSPRSTEDGTQPGDWLPADRRNLLGEVSTSTEVCAPPSFDKLFDMTVSPQSLIGLPSEFCEILEKLGGSSLDLAAKLMSRHHCDGSGEFVAGKLFGTEAQKRYYSQTLDAGPMVSRWSRTGYELPFASIPPNPLSASNNKSHYDNITFARAEVGRQVKMVILSEVP